MSFTFSPSAIPFLIKRSAIIPQQPPPSSQNLMAMRGRRYYVFPSIPLIRQHCTVLLHPPLSSNRTKVSPFSDAWKRYNFRRGYKRPPEFPRKQTWQQWEVPLLGPMLEFTCPRGTSANARRLTLLITKITANKTETTKLADVMDRLSPIYE